MCQEFFLALLSSKILLLVFFGPSKLKILDPPLYMKLKEEDREEEIVY